MRLQAWLNSTPEHSSKPRRENNAALSDIEPELYAVWLINDAFECGLFPLITWQEIKAWQEITHKQGIWLARAIKQLSESYNDEFNRSNNSQRLPPVEVDIELQRKTVSQQVKKIFRGQ